MRRLLGLMLLFLPPLARAAPPEPTRRLAVVVGSNVAIDGRPSLRYSHRDAQSVADVLTEAGRFAPKDVVVLLDPRPAAVLAALDAKLEQARHGTGPALLVFYYSGHADSHALFPGGEPLSIDALKQRLSSDAAALRVGIIDACRGGGWTAAKGLKPAESFEVGLPQLSSEGTVLLAASSGLEDAHEAESLQGSFFTHHLVAGLRGAADTTGDAQVTLSEAFGYANRMTIRDTAMASSEPQHPSFDMRLHGRQDIVLTEADASANVLTVEEQKGPLQIVQLSTGDVVVEAPAGQNTYRLALPPGDYLVRKVEGASVRARQVSLAADQKVAVSEASLELVGQPLLARKGLDALPPANELAVGGGGIPSSDGFWYGVTVDLSYTRRLFRHLGVRLRGLASFNAPTGLTGQLVTDFGVQSTPVNTITGALGVDAVVTYFRSERTASGFCFEPAITLGPTAYALQPMVRSVEGKTDFGPIALGAGATLGIEGSFRLPLEADLYVRPLLALEFVAPTGWVIAGGPARAPFTSQPVAAHTDFRLAVALTWRFGATR